MKKIAALLLSAAISLSGGGVLAEGITSRYESTDEYKSTLDSGFEYLGYSGVLTFSADFADEVELAGCEFKRTDGTYHPMDLKLVGKAGSSDFSLRLSGRGLREGTYSLTPYVIVGGEKKCGEEVLFEVSEKCELMTNLRIAREQMKGIKFEAHEQQLLDVVMPAVDGTIKAGEEGVNVTRKYVEATYPDDIARAKAIYSNVFTSSQRIGFMKKVNVIDSGARSFFIAFVTTMGNDLADKKASSKVLIENYIADKSLYTSDEVAKINEIVKKYHDLIDAAQSTAAVDEYYNLAKAELDTLKKNSGETDKEDNKEKNKEVLAHLNTAYSQLSEIRFTGKARKIMEIVLPVVQEVIKDGTAGEILITDDYIETAYKEDVENAKNIYSNEMNDSERTSFNEKILTLDVETQEFLRGFFS